MRVEDHLLNFLLEEKGFIALYINRALNILRCDSAQPDLKSRVSQFVDCNLFDLLPELAGHGKTFEQIFSTAENLFLKSQTFTKIDSHQFFDLLVYPHAAPSNFEPVLICLLSPETLTSSDLMHLLKEERRAKHKARQASAAAQRASTQFLANISHEIRTPLNGVIGMTDLLLSTPQSFEQREYTEIIRTSGEALLNVINDILDYSKIESNHVSLEEEPFYLRDAIEKCLDMHAARAAQKNIELAYSLAPACPEQFLGDKNKIIQILNNLVGNAVKFTDRGEIIVSSSCFTKQKAKSTLSISVRDTGIGIPQYAQKQIFAAFTQIESSNKERQGGTGLGLAISKRLVELVGGSLSVQSQVDKGSTFTFDLPIKIIDTPDAEKLPPQHDCLTNKRILVVDDNHLIRTILQAQLDQWGVKTVEAENGHSALELLKTDHHLDGALVDIRMPGMNGVQLVEKITQLNLPGDVPIVLMTSVDSHVNKDDLFKLNVQHFLTKPIKQTHLLAALLDIFKEKPLANLPQPDHRVFDKSLAKQFPLNILVAEDNQVNQKFIRKLLENLGYTPTLVSNGREALHVVEQEHFDVILMDIKMPELDGVEAAKQIATQKLDKRPHIIALTAHAMPGDQERFLNAGMAGYLSKPLGMFDLVQALKQAAAPIHNAQLSTAAILENTMNADHLSQLLSLDQHQNVETIIDLLETFKAESFELWTSLESAVESTDFDGIHRAAHTLKSSSAIVGAHQLADLSEKLIRAAQAADKHSLVELVHKMDTELKNVNRQMNKILRKLFHERENSTA